MIIFETLQLSLGMVSSLSSLTSLTVLHTSQLDQLDLTLSK